MKKYFVPDEALADDARDLENAVTAEIRHVYLSADVDALPVMEIIDAQRQKIAELEQQLAMATDAAAKGDLARQNAGGMELRIQELEKDAARYRWIRNADPVTCDPELIPTLDGTALDDGIDAALAGQGSER